MSIRLCRWGNSTGLRIPISVLEAAGLAIGRYVSLRVLDNGDIRIRPVGVANSVERTGTELNEKLAETEFSTIKW